MKIMNMNLPKRVTVHEEKGDGIMTFRKVSITYTDGDPYYHGWIQIFGEGDTRNGPTIFPQNYDNNGLNKEEVLKKDKYWDTPNLSEGSIEIRQAVPLDLDQIIDLRFQNYFDGGHERISAYQGLFHKINDDFLTLVLTVGGEIFGYIYIDLQINAKEGEAYIDSWFVAPGMRHRKAGTLLLTEGLNEIRKRGFDTASAIIIGTEQHCEYNAQILARCGFSVDYYFENTPLIFNARMVRTL
jgi:ribosomal protein S18 acetylase RimI-like enzyme